MKRTFLYLVVLTTLAVGVLWLFLPADPASGEARRDGLLLPGIAKNINDVDRVEIISAGNRTVATLLRTDGQWRLEQMDGYRADWSKLQALLAGLAQAKVVETKTDKPAYYARLGVEDVDAEDAGSVLVRLGIGDQTTGVLIGHPASGRPGQYVRLENSAASALVDQKLEVPTGQSDWADTRIIDINASEVAEVEIIHPQGERVMVTRISADQTDFDLVGLPTGREIKSSWAVNSLGSVLSLLDMESVQAADSVDWNGAVKLRLLTFSGVELMADVVEAGDQYLLRLHASYPAARVRSGQTGEDPSAVDSVEAQAADDVEQRVGEINRDVDGWAYRISKQKYDVMVKKPEDLLKPEAAS